MPVRRKPSIDLQNKSKMNRNAARYQSTYGWKPQLKAAETESTLKRIEHWRKNSHLVKKNVKASQDLMHCLNYNFNNDSSVDVTYALDDPDESGERTAELTNDEINVVL